MAKGLRLSGDNELAALQQSMRSRMREDEARHRTTDGGVEGHAADTYRPTGVPAQSGMEPDGVCQIGGKESRPRVSRDPRATYAAGIKPGPSTQFAPSEPRSVAGHSDGQINVADAAPSVRARADAATPKYRNKPTNGYASKREAKRAAELRTLEAIGDIRNLREQVPFLLIPKQDGERACQFVADFVYDERIQAAWPDEGWARVVEDVKGLRTPAYVIKRKLLLFLHGIRVRET